MQHFSISKLVQSCRCLLLPIKCRRLHRGFTGVTQLLLPSWIDLVRIFLESEEGSLDFFMCLGILHHTIRQWNISVGTCLPQLPSLFTLPTGHSALFRTIFVAEGSSSRRQYDIGMSQVLKECREPQRIHAARDNGCSLDHALPLLLVVGSISNVILKHVCNELVRGVPLHLAKAHSPNMNATGTDDTRDFGVHECSVSSLRLGAGDCTMASTMVVQELPWEVAASHGDSSATRHVAINQECRVL